MDEICQQTQLAEPGYIFLLASSSVSLVSMAFAFLMIACAIDILRRK